jgi:hypothetical protein
MHARLELVNGPTGLLPSTPIPDLTFSVQDNRQSNFIANWFPQVSFNDGARQVGWAPGRAVRYIGGTQNFQVGAALPPPLTNPGLTLFVRAQILRGAAVVFIAPPVGQFPPDQDHIPTFAMPISAPAVVPPGGDGLTFKVELLAGNRTTVLSTKNVAISVLPEVTYTQAQAQTEAAADDAHFHNNSPAGLLGIMTSRGGVAARVAAAVNSGFITLTPLTARHDSASYVATVRGAPDPSVVGYFLGSAYVAAAPDAAHSMVEAAGAAGFRLPDRGPRFIAVNRTTDVSTGAKRSDDEIITLTVHEAVHALDVRPGSDTILERYKTEFRAYWMDGRFGPPNQAICSGSPGCRDARFDPSLPPPGPKSPRARIIFEGLYGNITYRFVKTAYDNNTDGFREAVDNYLIPDGINLIASTRLEALRALIDGGVGGSFATFRASVQAFMGVGVPPPAGVLDADERNEIQRNRAWRDLVDRKVTSSVERNQIKSDLGIPL